MASENERSVSSGSERQANAFAGDLFTGIADSYDFWARVLSFGQYFHWRRKLVELMARPAFPLVLDVSTGRAGVAIEIASRTPAQVVGLDLTRPMLLKGRVAVQRSGLSGRIGLVQGRAESLPFENNVFDVVVHTFLLRYVADVRATLTEMARVLKPGGQMLSLEFGVPQGKLRRSLWNLHTGMVMPAATRFVSPGWRRVGAFLGPSIAGFYSRYPIEDLESAWAEAGMTDVMTCAMSQGGAVIMRGTKRTDGRKDN